MAKHIYSEGFEKFWEAFNASPSEKGRKYEAWIVWKTKSLECWTDEIIEGIQICVENNRYYKSKNQFVAGWQHACRWLKNKSWDAENRAEIERNKAIKNRKKKIKKLEHETLEHFTDISPTTDYAKLAEENPDSPFYLAMAEKMKK